MSSNDEVIQALRAALAVSELIREFRSKPKLPDIFLEKLKTKTAVTFILSDGCVTSKQ